MTEIENYRSVAKRTGIHKVPIEFNMCPSLQGKFTAYQKETGFSFKKSALTIYDTPAVRADTDTFLKYYNRTFKEGTVIDHYGVAHEPGSAAAFHMKKMYSPMADFDSVEQVLAYPLPEYGTSVLDSTVALVQKLHDNDQVAVGGLGCTVWERSWYLRGMENLMTDMMTEDPIAEVLFDRITDLAVNRAESYARSGVDVLLLGDDVGMQHSIMMSETMYCEWLKPRLTRVIRAAKAVNPDILITYHSCGFITPMIPHLIEAGIDILDPVQPECMDFREIHDQFGDVLSFHGTIGTQITMPFGTPDDVRREVFKNLEIAGDHGGLIVCPTHLLEPEVPVENVVAYIRACQDFM